MGIPRSGLLVANLLALYMNLPLADVDSFLEGRMLATGPRWKGPEGKDAGKVLIVDDSLASGRQMQRTKERVADAGKEGRVLYAAVYVEPGKEHLVDYSCEIVSFPRCFEWNIFHHNYLETACVDIDGVLCRDPTGEENDDGVRYRGFLLSVKPKLLPTCPIGWLVSCRLEKYRDLTEMWLRRHGVEYRNLVMMDLPDKASRLAIPGQHSSFKAQVYISTGARMFIESSLEQARRITEISEQMVLCVETGEMISPNEREPVFQSAKSKHAIMRSIFYQKRKKLAQFIRFLR